MLISTEQWPRSIGVGLGTGFNGSRGERLIAARTWLVLWKHELLRMFAVVLSMNLVRVGDAVFSTGCVTIGNPFGRIAIAAVTNSQEVLFDARWRNADLRTLTGGE